MADVRRPGPFPPPPPCPECGGPFHESGSIVRWHKPECGQRLEKYLALIEKERERRPAEAMLADEIKRLRATHFDGSEGAP